MSFLNLFIFIQYIYFKNLNWLNQTKIISIFITIVKLQLFSFIKEFNSDFHLL